MFGSEILEVAIGLVFIYLIFSLMSSSLKELISRMFALRAKTLEEGIVDLLGGHELGDQLYKHPLLQGVAQSSLWKKLTSFISKKVSVKKPTYVNPYHFYLALMDTMFGENGGQMTLEELEASIEKIPVPQVRKTLKGFLNAIKSETEKTEEALRAFRRSVEDWFDGKMAQLSIWYKRKTRVIIFFLTIFIVGALNVDTLMIARNLYKYDLVRQTVVAAAKERAGKEVVSAGDTPITMVSQVRAELEQTGLPIGWNVEEKADVYEQGLPVGFWQWFYKIIGLLITILAISMGAPFWFDMLKKLTAVYGHTSKSTQEPLEGGKS
jgi:hypothetical protein